MPLHSTKIWLEITGRQLMLAQAENHAAEFTRGKLITAGRTLTSAEKLQIDASVLALQ